MRTSRFAIIVLTAAFAVVGCKSDDNKSTTSTPAHSEAAAATTKTASATPVNKVCPVSGEALPANAKTVSYQGKTVGFCCGNCPAKWANLSDADKASKLAAACK
jgi:hypothetical protein